jgi:hypothetical protein
MSSTEEIAHFTKKFAQKTNEELLHITLAEASFHLEARMAAVQILQERGVQVEHTEAIKQSFKKRQRQPESPKANLKNPDHLQKVREALEKMSIGDRELFQVSRWITLELKCLKPTLYRIKCINHDSYASSRPWIFIKLKTQGKPCIFVAPQWGNFILPTAVYVLFQFILYMDQGAFDFSLLPFGIFAILFGGVWILSIPLRFIWSSEIWTQLVYGKKKTFEPDFRL